jgi:predicted amidohydrolase
VIVPGAETGSLSEAAARHQVGGAIGINERIQDARGHGTLYNSLLFSDENGRLANHHRKLIPTYSERMVWGYGDSSGTRCSKIHSVKVGGLICWEHWMPLARQHMHTLGEQVHVAAWPMVDEMYQIASCHYAFEGRCFVLAAEQIMHASALPLASSIKPGAASLIERGGSATIAPDGRYLAGPMFDEEATRFVDCAVTGQLAASAATSGAYLSR